MGAILYKYIHDEMRKSRAEHHWDILLFAPGSLLPSAVLISFAAQRPAALAGDMGTAPPTARV
jgi:hypothetical protein